MSPLLQFCTRRFDLLDICINGPKEKLDSTVISQSYFVRMREASCQQIIDSVDVTCGLKTRIRSCRECIQRPSSLNPTAYVNPIRRIHPAPLHPSRSNDGNLPLDDRPAAGANPGSWFKPGKIYYSGICWGFQLCRWTQVGQTEG